MEEIKVFVEQLINLTGINGIAVPIIRHGVMILFAILLSWVAGLLCRRLLVPLFKKIIAHTEVKWDDIIFSDKVLLSACHIVPAIVIWVLLPLVFYQYPFVRELLKRATAIYITVMSTRTLVVFIDGFNRLDDQPNRKSIQQYMRSFCGVLKIAMYFVATVVVVAIVLGKNPMTLFAGLGATSAILMLIFKDTITGLASGIRLNSNDMVHRGDWITVPGTPANGIVKDITLTTVKVQNFDNTIVTISPTTLVTGSFQNWIGMQQSPGRRVQRKFYLDCHSIKRVNEGKDTNFGQYRAAIKKYLETHKAVNANMLIMVRQMEGTQSGIPIEVYFFLKYKEWKVYEEHLASIMEHIYALAADFDVKLYEQYPEQ